MSYGIFSSVYDILTENVEYEKIQNKICSLLHKNGVDGGLLLDLGCGTGTLSFLLENKGVVQSRDQILNKIWGYSFDGESRTVDVHIRTLRQKLKSAADLIETVRGIGYKIGD